MIEPCPGRLTRGVCDLCDLARDEQPSEVPAPIEFGPDPDYDVAKALAAFELAALSRKRSGSFLDGAFSTGFPGRVTVQSERVRTLFKRLLAASALLLALASSSACASATLCPPAAREGHVDPKCCVGIPCYYPQPSDAGPQQ